MTFTYTVGAGENSGDLDYNATTSLTLNSGTIKDAATNDATLTLAAPGAAGSLGNAKDIVIDTTAPTVSGVTSSTADGSYKVGATVSIQVNFSENVTVTGTPQLALNSGATVNYGSGSGTSNLTFTYTVAGGENSTDLDYSGTGSLTLNGGTIRDAATNNAALTLATPGTAGSLGNGKNIVIDTTVPTVSSVNSVTADGAYKFGGTVSVQVNFSENVIVTGTPQLALNSGAIVNYASGSGTSTLTFTYTVGAGENSADLDYTATTSLTLNARQIKDTATNNATLTLPAVGGASSLGGQKAIVVDTFSPTATVTTPAISGTPYNAASLPGSIAGGSGDTGGSSTVSTVDIAIQDGGSNYWGGATFNQPTHLLQRHRRHRRRLDVLHRHARRPAHERPHVLDHRTLHRSRRQHGHDHPDVRLRHDEPDRHQRHLHDRERRVSGRPRVIPITVTFSETVNVTGTPTLALNSGGSASYASGSGTSTLTFNYTVGAGESTRRPRLRDDWARSPSRAARSRTSRRTTRRSPCPPSAAPRASAARRRSSSTRPTRPPRSPRPPATATPTTRPRCPATSPARAPTPAAPASAASQSRSRTAPATTGAAPPSTRARSSTTPPAEPSAPGPTPPPPSSASSPTATPTPITARSTDAAGNAGTSTRTFVYDTTSPTVTNVTSSDANRAYTTGEVVHVQITFNEAVTVTGTPQLTLNTTPSRTADYVSGSGTSTLEFDYTVQTGDDVRRPRLRGDELARVQRRHDQGRRHERSHTHPADRRRRVEPRRPEEHRRRHGRPDRVVGVDGQRRRRLQGR